MIDVGIEAINVFGGMAYLDVEKLVRHRRLDTARFENLLMKQKSVALPYEDPVTYAVNAAKPLIDALTVEDKNRIEMVITCTESGIDFGKSLSTYIHHYLGLNRNCRLFELKNACYSGVAGLQMAVNSILSQTSPGSKALVIATDISRMTMGEGQKEADMNGSYAEPSSGSGAVAMIVGEEPHVFRIDPGANGYYGYEVCDTCRPQPDGEAGNADLSLMSYLDCCEQTFVQYSLRVKNANYRDTFQYLAMHTPFGGMVKGAHRSMMRKFIKASPTEIEADFAERVMPGLIYCQKVGNIMGATSLMALAGTIEHARLERPKRIGCFSYGSGCCSEFYSGVADSESQRIVKAMEIGSHLDGRYELTMEEYDMLLQGSRAVKFGTRHAETDLGVIPDVIRSSRGKERLILTRIHDFHREYSWIS